MRNALLIGLCLFLGGCGPAGQVKTYPVKGVVKFDGKPMVGGGAISLVPVTDQSGKTAGGTIQPGGTYVLGTYKENDGSMAGEFRVVIYQETVKEEKATPDGAAPTVRASADVPMADRIPMVYSSTETPLTAKIETKANVIDFDLKRQ